MLRNNNKQGRDKMKI